MTHVATGAVTVTSLRGSELTPDREEWLVAGMVAALPAMKMTELFATRRDMFRDADLITVASQGSDGPAVGVLTSRWVTLPSGRRLLHILTQFVGADHQHGVTFRRSWAEHFVALHGCGWQFPEILVLKTYNPIAYCAMGAFSRTPDVTMYPDVSGVAPDPATERLAVEVAETVAAGHPFDPRTGVIKGAGVPRDLYPELPRSSHPAVNAWFENWVEPGDRVLSMLQVPTRRAAGQILSALSVAALSA